MGASPTLSLRRPQPDSMTTLPPLSVTERNLYELIKSKKNLGMRKADMRKETGLQDQVVNKTLKSLQEKNLIKDVVDVRNKRMKIFLAAEIEPSEEITGGSWYSEGSLDVGFITILREQCLKHIERLQPATMEAIHKSIEESRVFKVGCTMKQIMEIVNALVLDEEIEELKSTGMGDFWEVQPGKICYRSLKGRQGSGVGALASIPCGVCPRISECTPDPDAVISPMTCVYYKKWLNLQF